MYIIDTYRINLKRFSHYHLHFVSYKNIICYNLKLNNKNKIIIKEKGDDNAHYQLSIIAANRRYMYLYINTYGCKVKPTTKYAFSLLGLAAT